MSEMETSTETLPISGVKNYGRRVDAPKQSSDSKLNILYVCSEMSPFLETGGSSMASFVRTLAESMQSRGMEIRIIMPRFGLINERKNRLHEVLRLSGLNIAIGYEKKSLIIKVASVPNARMQVYFIDNEDYFRRKATFYDKKQSFYADNDERAIFFCKSVIETLLKLGWSPDVIHCNGWMTSLIPLYLKTTLREDPLFEKAKCIYTLHEKPDDKVRFSKAMLDKIKNRSISEAHVALLKGLTPLSMMQLGAYYADSLSSAKDLDPKVIDAVLSGLTSNGQSSAPNKTPFVHEESLAASYHRLYHTLVG